MTNQETLVGESVIDGRTQGQLTNTSRFGGALSDAYVSAAQKGAAAGFASGIRSAIAAGVNSALEEALAEAKREQHSLIAPYMADDEEIVSTVEVKQKLPFLLRVMPFVPDVLTAPKRFLLTITNRRLIVLRIASHWNRFKGDYVKKVALQVNLSDIVETAVRLGWSTRLWMRFRDGRRIQYHTHCAEDIADALRSAAACASQSARGSATMV